MYLKINEIIKSKSNITIYFFYVGCLKINKPYSANHQLKKCKNIIFALLLMQNFIETISK